MTQGYARPASQRWLALLLIVVLHGAGVLCWPKRNADSAGAARHRETALTFVSMPVRLPATAARPATPASRTVRKVVSAAPFQPMRLVAAPAPEPDVQMPAPPEKSAFEITLQAKRDVGKIDHELRAASLDMAQRHLSLSMTQRERAIGDAVGERGPPRIVEEVMSDGRRRSRIGNKCAYMESNGLVGARDVFRDGVKTRWGGC